MKKSILSSVKRVLFVLMVTMSLVSGFSVSNASSADDTNLAGDTSTLQTLISEVRQLRLAIQAGNVFNHRAQIIIERIKIENDQLNTIKQTIEQLDDEIQTINLDLAKDSERLQELGNQMKTDVLGASSQDARSEYESLSDIVAKQTQKKEWMKDKSAQSTLLAQEKQSQLDKLYQKLDGLEKEIPIN